MGNSSSFGIWINWIILMLLLKFACGIPVSEYVLVVDAGSTGTRTHVFHIEYLSETLKINEIEPVELDRTVIDRPNLEETLSEIVNVCKVAIPEEFWRTTEVYLLATAGMRMGNPVKVNDIMGDISEFFKGNAISPFVFKEARTISGEEEALFSFLTANFATGHLSDLITSGTFPEEINTTNMIGTLDMGGGSLQLDFVPRVDILAHAALISVSDTEGRARHVRMYANSFLGAGNEALMDRVKADAASTYSNCFNSCLNCTNDTSTEPKTGLGSMAGCRMGMNKVLGAGYCPYANPEKQCAVNQDYIPTIPKEQKFYSFSSFYWCIKRLGLIPEGSDEWTGPLREIQRRTDAFCSKDLSPREMADKYISSDCFRCSSTLAVLVDQLEFGLDSEQITFTNTIGGFRAGWALGSLIYNKGLLSVKAGFDLTPDNDYHDGKTISETGTTLVDVEEIAFIFLVVFGVPICWYIWRKRCNRRKMYLRIGRASDLPV
eukprot:1013998_1